MIKVGQMYTVPENPSWDALCPVVMVEQVEKTWGHRPLGAWVRPVGGGDTQYIPSEQLHNDKKRTDGWKWIGGPL